MILVDSTVLIDCLRASDAKLLALLHAEGAGVCGVVRAEILHGARNVAHRSQVVQFLDSFTQVNIPGSLWDAVGDTLAELRRKGVTVPFPDGVLATLAIALDVELWSRDQHFQLMQKVLPMLRLYQEPP